MRRLDIRGLIQPFSFLMASSAFKDIPQSGMLEILLSGPDAAADLFKILPASSYAVVSMVKPENEAGVRVQLKKIGC